MDNSVADVDWGMLRFHRVMLALALLAILAAVGGAHGLF